MENNYFEIIKDEFLVKTKTAFKFGSIGDGSYFVSPSNILEADILFSGGVSSNTEFEYDVFRFNKDISIIMVDPTVTKTKLLVKSIFRILLFKRQKLRYFINVLVFILMLQSGRVWHIKKWLSSKTGIFDCLEYKKVNFVNKTILLKLDIEGSEYELLDEILEHLDFFTCMVFEFHNLDEKHLKFYDFLKQCNNTFDLISLEINPSGGFSKFKQPKVVEITLERKSGLKNQDF